MTRRAPFEVLDTLGMWEAAAALPEQVSEALGAADDAFTRIAPVGGGAFGAVAAFGLGTGGMACAATAALTTPDLPVPFWVGHGSAVPAFVGADTLVLAVSSSGGTAETLTAAEKAVERGAAVVAVGGAPSGALAALAADAGLPWCPTPARSNSGPSGGGSTARAALGAATVALLVALARAGLGTDRRGRYGQPQRTWPGDATRSWPRARRPKRWPVGSGAPSRWSTARPARRPWRRDGGSRR